MYDPDRLKQIWTTPGPVLDVLDRIWTGLDRIWAGIDRIWTGLDRIWTGLDRIWTGLDQYLVVNCRLTITKYRFQSTVITAGRIIAVNSFNLRLLNGDKKGDKSFL